MEKIIVQLKEKNIVKEGEFTLKSGKKSNIYFDFKSLPNYPHLMNNISILFKEYLESNELTDKVICGVPYGGIPFASILSLNLNLPLMILRKEAKNYGTKKKLEGNLYYDKKVILVEDVITTGSSVIETIEYF